MEEHPNIEGGGGFTCHDSFGEFLQVLLSLFLVYVSTVCSLLSLYPNKPK